MPSSPPVTLSNYTLHDELGRGVSGLVYLASAASAPTPAFAVKVIPNSKLRPAVRREVALHYPLRHPNIVRLHAVHPARPAAHSHHHRSSSSSPSSVSLALVTELAHAGDMFAEVAATGSLPPALLRSRLADIVTALSYLHSHGIAHLDLKLENVVISKSNAAKLTDFGCAAHIGRVHPTQAPRGTLHYLAPEYLDNPSLPPDPAADAWSLGVLTYTALVGAYPFNGARHGASDKANDRATKYRILRAPPHRIPSSVQIPSDLKSIIYGLLNKDPAKRMTIPQVQARLASARRSSKSSSRYYSRPPSPDSPITADFDSKPSLPTHYTQTKEDALRIFDAITAPTTRPSPIPLRS